jgi:hypothetical protein
MSASTDLCGGYQATGIPTATGTKRAGIRHETPGMPLDDSGPRKL